MQNDAGSRVPGMGVREHVGTQRFHAQMVSTSPWLIVSRLLHYYIPMVGFTVKAESPQGYLLTVFACYFVPVPQGNRFSRIQPNIAESTSIAPEDKARNRSCDKRRCWPEELAHASPLTSSRPWLCSRCIRASISRSWLSRASSSCLFSLISRCTLTSISRSFSSSRRSCSSLRRTDWLARSSGLMEESWALGECQQMK